MQSTPKTSYRTSTSRSTSKCLNKNFTSSWRKKGDSKNGKRTKKFSRSETICSWPKSWWLRVSIREKSGMLRDSEAVDTVKNSNLQRENNCHLLKNSKCTIVSSKCTKSKQLRKNYLICRRNWTAVIMSRTESSNTKCRLHVPTNTSNSSRGDKLNLVESANSPVKSSNLSCRTLTGSRNHDILHIIRNS